MSHHVIIHYGPVDSFNLGVTHKPQFLYGLRDRLQKLGYRVELKPVEYLNYCMVEICGYQVFNCNIKNLGFNRSYNRDHTCQLAVKAVQKSVERFARAKLYPWLKEYLISHVFNNSSFKLQWSTHLPDEIDEMADVKTCAEDCCRILLSKDAEIPEPSQAKSDDEMHFDKVSKAFSRRISRHVIFQPSARDLEIKDKKTGDVFKDAEEEGLMSQLNVEERIDRYKVRFLEENIGDIHIGDDKDEDEENDPHNTEATESDYKNDRYLPKNLEVPLSI